MLGTHLVFLDSFQFMASSLERLAANLPVGAFKYTSPVFQDEELALRNKKEYILMIRWIFLTSLATTNYHQTMLSTVYLQTRSSLMSNRIMPKMYRILFI